MASQFADELVVLPGSPSSDVILDLTSDAAVAVPAPVLNDADDVLDGFQDPVMPVVILGLITFFAIIAIAAMLAL